MLTNQSWNWKSYRKKKNIENIPLSVASRLLQWKLLKRKEETELFRQKKAEEGDGQQSNFIFENDKNIWGRQKHFKEIKHSKDGKTKKIPELQNNEEVVKDLKSEYLRVQT